MNLYRLDSEINNEIFNSIDRETGEISDEGLANIEALEMDRTAKLLSIAKYALGEEMEGEAVKKRADELAARAKSHAKRAARLYSMIEKSLGANEFVRDDEIWVKWRKSSAVSIDDLSEIPFEYMNYPEPGPATPDKAKIAAALKEGAVTGASIEKRRKLVIA